MFEKEAKERAERKINNFIPFQWGVSLIRTEQTYETVEGAPHFYLRSLAKMWKEGSEYGYNTAKEEQKKLEEDGVALQSDMDKTIELYMKQKEINKELVDESEKLKDEINYQRSGWEKATVKLATASLSLDLAKAIIRDFRDWFRENVHPCPYSMLGTIMQADNFLEEKEHGICVEESKANE